MISLLGVFILLYFEFAALRSSQNLMTLLKYSTVAEVGYMLLGWGAGVYTGEVGAILHLENQILMRGLVFLTAWAIIRKFGSTKIEELKGIGKKSPFLAILLAYGIFSIMGLSPFKGSISKFLIIYADIAAGHYIYAGLAAIGSIVEAYYFIHVIQKLCFESSEEKADFQPVVTAAKGKFPLQGWVTGLLVLLSALTAITSLFPEPMLHSAESILGYFGSTGSIGDIPVIDYPWDDIVLLPYVGSFLVLICGFYFERVRDFLAIAIFSVTVYLVWNDASLDGLSRLFTIIVAIAGLLGIIYSAAYFHKKKLSNRYMFFLLFMLASLIGVTSSQHFSNFYTFWELMTWSSYLLVIHDQTPKALKAGFMYFMMCVSGAYLMQLGILVLYHVTGTFDMAAMNGSLSGISPSVLAFLLIAFLVGTGVKAGMVPLHSWLPAAHPVAPSPVSSLLSGILTKMGIYGMIRILYVVFGGTLLMQTGEMGLIISLLGVLTLFYGEIMALYQTDIKRMLAFSTMAQLGEIIITLGVGTYLSIYASMYHVLNHAIMKSLLFLAVGSMIYRIKSQQISDLKGVGKVMPFTSICLSIGILSIMGLPPFGGFNSKFLMLYANVAAGHWYYAALILIGSIIGAFYYIKIIRTLFFEKYEGSPIKEAPFLMLLPIGILTGLTIFNGIFPHISLSLVKAAVDSIAVQAHVTIAAIPELTVQWPLSVIILLIGGVLTYIVGHNSNRRAGWCAVAVTLTALAALVRQAGSYDIAALSFALLIVGVGALNLLYSLGYMEHNHKQSRYYMFFVMMIGGLTGVALSKDLFSFFVCWEIMSSWTLYFVIIHEETAEALREGFKYFIFNYIGANCILLGMLVLAANTGVFGFEAVTLALGNIPLEIGGAALLLMTIGFLMKAAMLPLRIDYQMHPAAAPTPVSGYISAVLLKSAPFWLLKLFFMLGGMTILARLGFIGSMPVVSYAIAWLSCLTILGAAIMALLQNGIKMMLVYSTVSQIGYIILGLSLGSTAGIAGGLLHFINHMIFKNLLFLAAGAIMLKAHAYSLDEVGGLGRKMPWTLLFFMIGALSLAGVPPFSGFASKWLIYEAAMEQGQPVMAIISLIASVLTMAYFIKFMHTAFFGALPQKFEHVTDPPWTMLLPMGLLGIVCMAFGFMPGIPLQVISAIQTIIGMPEVSFTLTTINTPLGSWQAGITAAILLLSVGIGIFISRISNQKVRVTEVYTCGVTSLKPEEMHVNSENLYGTLTKTIRDIFTSRNSDTIQQKKKSTLSNDSGTIHREGQ